MGQTSPGRSAPTEARWKFASLLLIFLLSGGIYLMVSVRIASADTPPSISASPSVFNAGCSGNLRCATKIMVSGVNFPAAVQGCGVCVVVWLDEKGSGTFGGVDPFAFADVDNTGAFSGTLVGVGDFPVGVYQIYASLVTGLSPVQTGQVYASTSVTVGSSFSCVSSELAWRSYTKCTLTVIDLNNQNNIPSGTVTFHSSDIFDGTSYGAQSGVSFGAAFFSGATTCTLVGKAASGSTPATGSCAVYYTEDNCPTYVNGNCLGRTAFQNHDVTITAIPSCQSACGAADGGAQANVEFKTCFLHPCLVNDQNSKDDYKLYICVLGDSKYDLVNYCLLMEQDYTSEPDNVWVSALANTNDPPYIGTQFPGAGLMAAAAGWLACGGVPLPPGSPPCGGGECAPFTPPTAIDQAIAYARSQGEDVPGAGGTCVLGIPTDTKSLTQDYWLGYDFITGNLADNQVRCSNGSVSSCQQVGVDLYLMEVVGGLVLAGQQVSAGVLFSYAAATLAVGCGYTDDHCFGRDLTANLLANPTGSHDNIPLQKKSIPIPLVGGQLAPVWGYFIGWSAPPACTLTGPLSQDCPVVVPNGIYYNGDICGNPGSCPGVNTPQDFSSACQSSYPTVSSGCPAPGSGGSVPQGSDPLAFGSSSGANPNGPIKCVTGKADGRSIGYDGDVSFDLQPDSSIPALPGDTPIQNLVNVYNFLPGEGGSAAPNGIDIELSVALRPMYFTQLSALTRGSIVHVCGHWVTDMHDFWNELHPITSLCVSSNTPCVSPDAPTISVTPSSVDPGQSATLTTTSHTGSGTPPYTCQWLVAAPGAGTYSDLGSAFACAATDLPSTSTGALGTAGTWSFELQVTDSGNPANVVASNAVTVTVGGTVVTYTGAVSGDYGDTVVLAATLKSGATGSPISGEPITFKLGSHTLSGTTDAAGVATATVQLDDAPSSYLLSGSFGGDAPAGWSPGCTTSASGTGCQGTNPQFTIGKEDTAATYTGDVVVSTTVGTFALRATLQVDGGTGPADSGLFSNAYATFYIYSAATTNIIYTISHVPLTVITQSELGTAMVSETLCSSKVITNCLTMPEGTYVLTAQIDPTNGFYSSTVSEGVPFTVYTPTGAFTSGGGWVVDPTGSHGNFAFVERYNKNGQPLGQSVYIYRESCGAADIAGLLTVATSPAHWCDVMVKSNSMIGLAIGATCSVFQGKASIQVIDESTDSLVGGAGNYQFTVHVCNGGRGVGTYAIQVLNTSGLVFHLAGNYPTGVVIDGGMIVVHKS